MHTRRHQQKEVTCLDEKYDAILSASRFVLAVGGWTREDPSCLVEQFCPEYNEWRTAARMISSRGSVAVGTLDGEVYTVGGEDNVRCYSSVER